MNIWFPWNPMTKIQVSKFHGCGNDFILTTYEAIKDLDIVKFVQKVCDRHSGIGADGAIFVKEDPTEMIYYNQDGSRAPMCGNGIRCFAGFCYEEGLHQEKDLKVQTLAGEKIVHRMSDQPFLVKVDMGFADYDPQKVGTKKLYGMKQLILKEKRLLCLPSSCQQFIPFCLVKKRIRLKIVA